MVQVLDVAPDFSLATRQAADAANPDILAWEELMWRFQLALPFAGAGEKWVRMTRLFLLREALSVRDLNLGADAAVEGSESEPNGG